MISIVQKKIPSQDASLYPFAFLPVDESVSSRKKILPPKRVSDNIIIEATNNAFYKEQYYQLREMCYRRDLGIDHFDGSEDDYDRDSIIVIAREGRKVVAGARLTISSPSRPMVLPLEEKGFIMSELFPELKLASKVYCETTRFAIHPDFRSRAISFLINKELLKIGNENNCSYQFTVAPLKTSRNNAIIGRKLGLLHKIIEGIKIPYKPIYGKLYEKGMVLSITYLYPNTKNVNSATAEKHYA